MTLLPMEGDYTKLTIDAPAMGYTGEEITRHLDLHNMDWEYADQRFVVLMLSPCNTQTELAALEQVLLSLPRRQPRVQPALPYALPNRQMELRQAYFAPRGRNSLVASGGTDQRRSAKLLPSGGAGGDARRRDYRIGTETIAAKRKNLVGSGTVRTEENRPPLCGFAMLNWKIWPK